MTMTGLTNPSTNRGANGGFSRSIEVPTVPAHVLMAMVS